MTGTEVVGKGKDTRVWERGQQGVTGMWVLQVGAERS
jgi:hypothetical protein